MTDESFLLRQSKAPITLHVEGSRVLYWPARGGTGNGHQTDSSVIPTGTLIFIVGNPGLANYYVRYLSELQKLVQSDDDTNLEVFCISQLGHDPNALEKVQKMVTLDEQIENKIKIVQTIHARWKHLNSHQPKPKLILAGHSIGAYMALEIVRRKTSSTPKIDSIHLLFPALHQLGLTPNARRLSWLLKADDKPILARYSISLLIVLTWIVSLILKIVQFLPLPIVHFLVLCAAPSQPMEAIKITSEFILDSQCVQQALSMGREEMKLVQTIQALEEEDPKTNGSSKHINSKVNGNGAISKVKLRAYWAAGDLDGWAPESTRLAVEETLGLKGYELPADIIEKHTSSQQFAKTLKKRRSYTVEEIRKARRSGDGVKRRALAGMVHAGASAGYGLASSIGHLGYRRSAAAARSQRPPPRAPSSGMSTLNASSSPLSSPSRGRKRRPSLVSARASRRFDGTIVIEPAEDEELDLLAPEDSDGDQSIQGSGIQGVVFSPAPIEPTLEEALAPGPTGGNMNKYNDVFSNDPSPSLSMPDRASIVCKLGMPHAFVLEHSDKMATISSAMILADLS